MKVVLPDAVVAGMTLAALAHAESCDVIASNGCVELTCRYEPSAELEAAFCRHRHALVGVLGWAVPLERPKNARPNQWAAVQWRTRGWGAVGEHGRN